MKTILSILALVLCLGVATSTFAETWTKFFSSASEYDFFYNAETLTYPDKDTVLIWYKSMPQQHAEIKAYVQWVELREVDCSRRRYKRLQGEANYESKPMKKLGETSWTYLEPYDLDISFYNTACGQKK